MSSGVQYFTREGLEKIRKELDHLKNVKRKEVAKQIQEAREKGDLSENAEYDAAKEAQGLLEARIAHLENIIARARVLDAEDLDLSKVRILSTVHIENLSMNKEMKYTLVSEAEANLQEGKISVTSPIGKALLGKSVGEIVEVNVPAGTLRLRIKKITIS